MSDLSSGTCLHRKENSTFHLSKPKGQTLWSVCFQACETLEKTLLRALFRQNGDKNSSRKTSDDYGTKNGDVISPNNMNYLEGRVTRSLERQRSRAAFCHVAATEEKSGYLWKTFHHPGRTSSKTRYFVLTKSSLDHFRNHHRVINNNRVLIIVSIVKLLAMTQVNQSDS